MTIGIGRTEAETLALLGTYGVESVSVFSGGAGIKATGSGTGTASGTFTGAPGTYWIDVDWFNENDGVSQFALLVNGAQQGSWTGSGGSNTLVTQRVAVTLNTSDTITLQGVKGAGEYARIDSLTVSERSATPPPPPPPPPSGEIGLGKTEAEGLSLGGTYGVESVSVFSGGAGIKATGSGTGTASGTFTGAPGTYWIDVDWFNENDGVSQFALLVNGAQQGSWTGSGGSNTLVTQRVAVTLNTSDTITLQGVKGAGEYARIDSLTVSERSATPPPPPPPPPSGEIGLGKTEAEGLSLGGTYGVESVSVFSGGAGIKATGSGTGTASGTFTGAPGTYWIDVDWFNENDGVSQFALLVNGAQQGSWTGSGGSNTLVTQRVAVTLNTSDTITLQGVKGAGEYARIDSLTVSERSATPPPPPPPPPSGEIGLGKTEAEGLSLGGTYGVESVSVFSGGAGIKATGSGTGTASGTFTGAPGTYWIDVDWFNENDGVSQFALLVNGAQQGSWTGSGGSNTLVTQRVAVTLNTSDTITLQGVKGAGEYARIDSLTVSERSAVIPGLDPDDFDFFAFTGQSNAERHFSRESGDNSAGPLGYVAFETEVERLTGASTTAIEAATGGSGSHEGADVGKYWWNLTEDRPGPSLVSSVNAINAVLAAGKDLDGIIWAQGEDDAYQIDVSGKYTAAQAATLLKQATTKVFEYFWDTYGANIPIFIQELGEFDTFPGLSALRTAQEELIAELPNVYFGASTAGVPQFDSLHFTVDGYNDIAFDLATAAVDVLTGGDLIA